MLDVVATVGTILSSAAIVVVCAVVVRMLLSNRAVTAQAQPSPSIGNRARAAVSSVDGLETTSSATSQHHQGAALAIVEFSDFQCSFCGRYARDTYPRIRRELVDPGAVDYVFRSFPLESLHPLAFKAGEAAECAGEQGHYWDMHDQIFASPEQIDQPGLMNNAHVLGLDEPRFRTCLAGGMASKIKSDVEEGRRLGVDSTPTFFVGRVLPDGKIRLIRRIEGAQPYETFKAQIDDLRTGVNKTS